MKEPATQAVAAAEASLAPIKEDAEKYTPDALRSDERAVTDADLPFQ
ncbi:MAG: hypothetical protein WDO68_10895 [Gammaproteobacteria bacterium]